MTWEQELVNAQVDVNRAVFEMNVIGEAKPKRKVEPRYVMLCIARAHHALMRAYVFLELAGAQPFSEREFKRWEKKA